VQTWERSVAEELPTLGPFPNVTDVKELNEAQRNEELRAQQAREAADELRRGFQPVKQPTRRPPAEVHLVPGGSVALTPVSISDMVYAADGTIVSKTTGQRVINKSDALAAIREHQQRGRRK
jgi:hypothetical protein